MSRSAKTEERIRFTLELSPVADESLTDLAREIGLSKAEVLRRGVAVMGVILEARKKRNRFAITNANLKPLREIVLI